MASDSGTTPGGPPTQLAPTESQKVQFGSDEPLWYANGRWGDAGYAIANPGGKTWTNNSDMYNLMNMLGLNVFNFAHDEAARFYDPPHKQFWYDVHQMLTIAIKRLADLAVAPNTNNVLKPLHANPTPRVFLVYPVPFFGARIRQQDIRRMIERMLMLQSETMQHSDNEREGYFTVNFAGLATSYLQDSLVWIATKYFGYTRDEAYAPGFKIADERFTAYNPSKVLTSAELTTERQPPLDWPTENDLAPIRGLPVNEALLLCKRWPTSNWLASAQGNVLVTTSQNDPGGTNEGASSIVQQPGRAP